MSKFDKIFEAREVDVAEVNKTSSKDTIIKKNVGKKKDTSKIVQISSVASEQQIQLTNQPNVKQGRPTAKRSDPDFVGLTTYIRRDTHTRAKIALLQERNGRELSELVEDLIYAWLSKK